MSNLLIVANSFRFVRMILPVIYCGSLAYYFSDYISVAPSDAGSTVIGLGAIGILFAIPPLLFLLKLIREARGGKIDEKKLATDQSSADEPQSDFDADAALARYLARREQSGAAPIPTADAAPPPPPAPRPGFGRRGL